VRVAVVGGGVSGLVCAHLLASAHAVDLYEAQARIGGHTDTHEVEVDGQRLAVDTGFIVCNRPNYPLLFRLFDALGVETRATTMSFAVRNERSGLEYNAGTNGGLFVQKRNLFSPRHWGMILDILRFYREAPSLLALDGAGPTIAGWLREHRYGEAFVEDHLVPMASALWSTCAADVAHFPAKSMVAFMANHRMLQVEGRPEWRTVVGGSARYVDALRAQTKARWRLGDAVRGVRREQDGVAVTAATGTERYDHVVFACHADEALARAGVLAERREREILGAVAFQDNDTVLHTDASQLPRDRRAWAAWNAIVPREPGRECTVSYCMNLLQGLPVRTPVVVTLNRTRDIDPAKVLARRAYRHPVYTHATVAAQARRAEIDGVLATSYCGAWWGHGFHEDGVRSAVEVAARFGAALP
jgi:uncharacterized protein